MSSSISLQLDLSGLSNSVVNWGAHGLKQYAAAGIGVHTIGALLLLTETTPACYQFRRHLMLSRDCYRKEKGIWLYKIIELGAGANFLADKMLGSRSGENSISLLASLIPFFDEQGFQVVLTEIFRKFDKSGENTPGLGQISQVRSSLQPFVNRLGFQEHVLNYNSILQRLSKLSIIEHNPNNSVVRPECMPDLLEILCKLAQLPRETSEPRSILLYTGLDGAAWLIAYVKDVLDLGIGVKVKGGEWHPIHGTEENARVMIDLDSPGRSFGFYVGSTLEELLHRPEYPSSIGASPWTIDCSKVNFVDHHFPALKGVAGKKMIRCLSHVAALETIQTLRTLINYDYYTRFPTEGLQLISNISGLAVQKQSLIILQKLGFEPESLTSYCARLQSPEYMRIILSGTAINFHSERPVQILAEESIFHSAMKAFLLEYKVYDFDEPINALQIITKAVALAVVLAFTNWGSAVSNISQMFFGNAALDQDDFQHTALRLGGISRAHPDMEMMPTWIIRTITGRSIHEIKNVESWQSESLAREVDGILFLKPLAFSRRINLDGCIMRLRPGHIKMHDEIATQIREEPWKGTTGSRLQDLASIPAMFCPFDAFSNRLNISGQCRNAKNTIWARTDVMLDNAEHTAGETRTVRIRDMVWFENNFFVSAPCPHLYKTKLSKSGLDWREGLKVHASEIGESDVEVDRQNPKYKVFYQQVSQNPLGQWVALAYQGSVFEETPGGPYYRAEPTLGRTPCILQRETCLDCVIRQWEDLLRNPEWEHIYFKENDTLFIIAGGL
jgi:hypothetical protein